MHFTSKHDQQRAERLKRILAKAKERAEETLLYLNANERPMEERWPVEDALVHVENALERLGVRIDEEATVQ